MSHSKVYIGIDVGSVSIKVALVGGETPRQIFARLCAGGKFFPASQIQYKDLPNPGELILSLYRRIRGEPVKAMSELYEEIFKYIPGDMVGGLCITGSGGKRLGRELNIKYENDFFTAARGIGALYPGVKTILEMGGDNSRYLRIDADGTGKGVRIIDYEANKECAAGTGSFMDQQASRLLYDISEVGDIVSGVERSAAVAGRCSVFAKSDMIHAQQKGFLPGEVLKGLCEAVVRNFKGTITKGKEIVPPVAFIGGVAGNKGVSDAIKTLFNLDNDSFFVPRYYAWMGAIGAALGELESRSNPGGKNENSPPLSLHISPGPADINFPVLEPLSMTKVVLLRHLVKPWSFEGKSGTIEAYLGIDIGSVSTKFVLMDRRGDVIKQIYTRTNARPIDTVKAGLSAIDKDLGARVHILGAGTTGSGRELIGELIGADAIHDEITAHKTGALHISRRFLQKNLDTVFDIGGQDSKFITVQDGIVVDFTMNNACAAGTGSFLEEQGEKLAISIEKQFARMALRSKKPLRLGERCTVFVEKDVQSYLQKGAAREDIAAGLAYSVAINYLNRVVRGRRIGDVIYFQGGTAYNDAVAAALSTLLDKEIVVPPYNGVIGALGAALLARDKMARCRSKSTFRGFDINKVNYSLRHFTCKGCSNYCSINQCTVAGQKTYWGNKCSERFKNKPRSANKPVIVELLKLRKELLLQGYRENSQGGPKIGMLQSLYFHDRFPFWNTFFKELGFQVVLSEETHRQTIANGIEATIAEPCFPVALAHGHVQTIVEKDVDYIFLPNQFNAEADSCRTQSMFCPWGQTFPFVIRNHPVFKAHKQRMLIPTVHFRKGIKYVARELGELSGQLAASKAGIRKAVKAAYQAQQEFEKKLQEAGQAALEKLARCSEPAVVLLGRPYNLYDRAVNLNVPGKLCTHYGINVIPMEFLPLHTVSIEDINENMYWNYGKKILQAARWVGQQKESDFHIIYITNFKCGPDSYVKHYIRQAAQKPFLLLQFDGHGNDAGIMTRCEAFLQCIGMLK